MRSLLKSESEVDELLHLPEHIDHQTDQTVKYCCDCGRVSYCFLKFDDNPKNNKNSRTFGGGVIIGPKQKPQR